MASTDTRSGFRLPWSSDRSQDDTARHDAEAKVPETIETAEAPAVSWPESDFAARAGFATAQQRPVEESTAALAPALEPAAVEPVVEPAAVEPVVEPAAVEPAAAPPKKPSKLMADLAAAIRATTEDARDQRLSALQAEADGIIELIRTQSAEGATALRRRSDEDVAAIRDWAKAEIARIKEASEGRIADRKHLLEQEVADHAAAIEERCAAVETTVGEYRRAMGEYFEHLQAEDDPSRLATLAEAMPDPPTLASLSVLDDLAVQDAAAGRDAGETGTPESADADASIAEPVDDTLAPVVEVGDEPGAAAQIEAGAPFDEDAPLEAFAATDAPAEPQAGWGETGDADAADVPRWAAGDTPEGFPEPVEGGDPVDRGAIMAALEAAAEAVVAAEAAAESAETAEAAADVAETAAELVAGRAGAHEADPEAQAALSARVDAGGFETESYQDRLASLLPGHAEASSDGEPRTTQVVVSGLVSVASIASFKRHLGRLAGVSGVAVASGPEGEFIFNVTHRLDVSFRDAIPTLPGFAARVVATGEGVVSVTARDPEAEG